MHRALREITFIGLLSIAIGAAGLAWPQSARAAEAAMTVTLEGGKWKAVRLRNLPRDAVVAVAVQSTGRIGISLLSERDYRAFPRPAEPVFAGSVDRTLSFTISIPEIGHYYVVLDNRRATEAVKVKLELRARRGRSAPSPSPAPTPESPSPQEKLRGT
jgi:hypothetical protein